MTIRTEYFSFARLTKAGTMKYVKVSTHEASVGSKGCKTAAHDTEPGAGWSVPAFSGGSLACCSPAKHFNDVHSGGGRRLGQQP